LTTDRIPADRSPPSEAEQNIFSAGHTMDFTVSTDRITHKKMKPHIVDDVDNFLSGSLRWDPGHRIIPPTTLSRIRCRLWLCIKIVTIVNIIHSHGQVGTSIRIVLTPSLSLPLGPPNDVSTSSLVGGNILLISSTPCICTP
jgi:hypothetical protein